MAEKNNDNNVGHKIFYNYNTVRSTSSQIFAVLIGNIIMLQFGMSISMSTVVNGQLMSKGQNSTQTLTLDPSEASWYGSLLLLAHPVGSILSSFVQDKFGRKLCFTLVALPEFVGWLCLYLANSSLLLYVSSICLGIAMGLSEAPILIYIGECVEPRMRSGLSSFTVFCSMIGLFLTFSIASVFSWRQTALMYLSMPLFVFAVTILIIPESPVWLLSKQRTKEASKSLRWLRGFTNANAVRDELGYMTEYAKHRVENEKMLSSKKRSSCFGGIVKVIEVLKERSVLHSFIMFNVVFVLCTITAMLPTKPYWLNIMREIGLTGLPFGDEWALVFCGACTLLGAFLNMFTAKYIAKRTLLVVSISISTALQFTLGLFAMGYLKPIIDNSWIPFCSFCCINFISGYGITPIPWILLGEIFPMKSRGILSGVTAALNSIMAFFLTKTYWNVVNWTSLPCTIIIHAVIGVVGIPYIYFNLPDTENKTLLQIQNDLKSKK